MPLMGARFLLLTSVVGVTWWATTHRIHEPLPGVEQNRLPLTEPARDPVMILRERYARGEISLETFEEMLERVEPGSDDSDASAFL